MHRALQYERLARLFFDEENKRMAEEYTRHAIVTRRGIAERYGVKTLAEITPAMVAAAGAVDEGRDEYTVAVKRYVMKQRKSHRETLTAKHGLTSSSAAKSNDEQEEEEEDEESDSDADATDDMAKDGAAAAADEAGILASLVAGDPSRPVMPVIDLYGDTAAGGTRRGVTSTGAPLGDRFGSTKTAGVFSKAINSLATGTSPCFSITIPKH